VQWTQAQHAAAPIQKAATSRLRYTWSSLKSLGTRLARHADAVVSKAIDTLERK
jgi:hypothetical protein